jgi:5-phospho-D-xylono-1,4-lactonase
MFPAFRLDDADRIVVELQSLQSHGIDWLIDCMPGEAGRDVSMLQRISAASGVHIVAATGVHLAMYYADDSALLAMDKEQLAERFIVETTCDACGVIKIAGGKDHLSDFERCAFRAAAVAHRATGCPIITHTENGTAAMEQVDLLVDQGGCDSSRVTLSHVDRIADPDYHRALLQRGVTLEYDGHFRWKDCSPKPTVELIATLLPEFPGQIVVGMDAARSSYWTSYGGSPGLCVLATTLREQLVRRGVSEALLRRLYVDNARRAFSFSEKTS